MSRASFRRAGAIGCLAALLIAIKCVFPASDGIERCWWAPHVAIGQKLSPDACLRAAEPFVKSIHFGPAGEPWRPGLHNTLSYNLFQSCPEGDTTCALTARWRARDALPFRATFALSSSRLPAREGLSIAYAGRIELELPETTYYPRHYVLIAHAAAYLSLFCGTRLAAELGMTLARRSSP